MAVIAGGILVSPLVIAGHTQQSWQIGRQATPHVASSSASAAACGRSCSPPCRSPSRSCCSPWRPWWRRPTRARVHRRYALALAIVPVVAVWLISRGPTSYWTFRYMLFSITGWSVGAGIGIAYLAERAKGSARLARLSGSLSPRFAVAAVLVAVVGLLGIHDQLAIRQNEAHNLWAYPEMPSNGHAGDYQAAAAVIAANERPGDGIVYQTGDLNHYQVDTAMAYYLRGKLPTAGLPGADAGPGQLAAADRMPRPGALHNGHAAALGGLR